MVKSYKTFCAEAKTLLSKKTPSEEDLQKKYKMTDKQVDKLVDAGAKVEKEHTRSKKAAEEIARDHIGEKPKYYAKLKKYVE